MFDIAEELKKLPSKPGVYIMKNADDEIIYVNVNKKGENVIISIRDFGIGMSEKYLDKIFDRFIQVDNTMTRKNEGSGIGLSIVKSFVSLHNGSISVKSKENEGSEFVIHLPINLIEDKELFLYDSEVLDFNIKTELSDIYMSIKIGCREIRHPILEY